MTTDTTTVNDASTGAGQQQVQEPPAGATDAAGNAATVATPAPTFTTEQQAYIDKLVGDRLKRERAQQQAAIDKAKADAEAAALVEQGKFKDLWDKAEADKQAAINELTQVKFDQQRRDAAQAAGIPQLWQRLQGDTAEALAEDAKALAAMMQPATNGQPARQPTQPTPPPQGTGGLTPEERRQRAARTI